MDKYFCQTHKCKKEPSAGGWTWHCKECDLEQAIADRKAELIEALGELAYFRLEKVTPL